MKGLSIVKLLSLSLLLGLLVCVASAFAAPAVPSGPVTMNKTKKPVVFDHTPHKALKCDSCHHPVEGKEEFRPCSTSGCHDIIGVKEQSANGYHRIRHGKNLKNPTCISCHTEVVAKNPDKKQALLGCKDSKCHSN